jgi:hypothetical protein
MRKLAGGLGKIPNLSTKTAKERRRAALAQDAKHRELAEREPTNGPLTSALQRKKGKP